MQIIRTRFIHLIIAAATLASSSLLRAGDVTWTDDFGNFLWNTTDPNWSTGMWNNANGDGAIFGAAGAGAINVTSPINVSSLNFTANGYTLGGAGSLTFVLGTSTLGYGFVNVADSVTATINTAVNSSAGLIKLGAGTLQIGGPMTFSGPGLPIGSRGTLPADLIVGGGSDSNFNAIPGGTIKILNSSVLPATARLGVSNGLFDLGSNDVTIAALSFVNQANYTTVYNPVTGVAGAGVFGTGTLRVTGDISVLGVNIGNFSPNAIGNNLDLGGGTQVIRTAVNGSFASFRALELTGSLSNGSLLKTFGVTESGILGNPDGLGLFGNNTYTGSTTINGGSTVVTGTNATTSVRIVGDRGLGAPNGTNLTLQGANGSLGSATTIQAVAGAQFIIDNNVAVTGPADPNVPATQNNDRIRDDAEIQLRDGSFIYRGLSATAGSETFGNLNIQGGHNNVTLTPGTSGGTVTVTANGNLTLAQRATLQVTSSTLGGSSKMFINGAIPAADATGILSHVVGSTDFLTYNTTTGLTPYTGYATDFTSAGTNVAVTAAASVPNSINVNAIKSTGSFATTIAEGQTLGVTSGMMLNTTGTRTYTGGTIAFGANPGVFFAGSAGTGGTTINSAITGTGGLINTNSATLALNGDLSGLTGTITNGVGFATTTLATNTFAGAIEVRGGTFNITTSQTLAGQGAITLGVAANDQHLINNALTLSFSGAGTGSTIGRDIIVDNGSYDAAGLPVTFGFIPTIAPLSNSGTNVQTLSGNITLNSPVRLQGGGGTSGTGYTALTGNISGPAQFFLANGRQTLSGSYSNAGGFRMGEQGFTEQATFTGTPIGTAPIVLEGGNNSFVAYNAGSLPTGTITEEGATGFTTSLNPLQNSTINNAIVLGTTGVPGGTLTSNVASGVTGNWNGQISGTGGITKATGTGTLVLNGNNTYTGNTTVNAGTLLVNSSSASALHTVANAATLGGNGSIGAVTVNTGGTLSPGSSIGTFATGNLTLSGTFLAEINLNNGGAASADLVNLAGNFSITGGTLELSLSNLPLTGAPGIYLLAANDGSDGITGTFASIIGLPEGYTATVDYGFTGTDSLGRIGNGNDLAVQVVPEPQSYALLVLGGLLTVGLLRLRRRRV